MERIWTFKAAEHVKQTVHMHCYELTETNSTASGVVVYGQNSTLILMLVAYLCMLAYTRVMCMQL